MRRNEDETQYLRTRMALPLHVNHIRKLLAYSFNDRRQSEQSEPHFVPPLHKTNFTRWDRCCLTTKASLSSQFPNTTWPSCLRDSGRGRPAPTTFSLLRFAFRRMIIQTSLDRLSSPSNPESCFFPISVKSIK